MHTSTLKKKIIKEIICTLITIGISVVLYLIARSYAIDFRGGRTDVYGGELCCFMLPFLRWMLIAVIADERAAREAEEDEI